MKRRVDPSVTFLAPLVIGGVAVLVLLVADEVLPGMAERRMWLAILVGSTVYGTTAMLLALALRPLRRLMASARQVSVLSATTTGRERSLDDLERMDRFVGQVAEVLDKLDAKALFPEMIGESRPMRAMFSQILKVAPTETTVLLVGESGSGKELVARAIHAQSPRNRRPFVAFNCAAIPAGLLESELFGHEKGAFTGACARKIGKFEQASGGTLFLDEIGDMPLEIQAKMLRVIETRECERLGGDRPVALDVRILAATHRDLVACIASGDFREDLFHRLNVFPLRLPPLRERREDIPLLAGHFLEEAGRGQELSVEALQRLMAHSWPGNVRELRNVMERAVLLAGDATLVGLAQLPGLAGSGPGPTVATEVGLDLDDRLAAYEKALIEAALSRTGGVQARAAQLLGIKERSLWHRVRKLGVSPDMFKPGK